MHVYLIRHTTPAVPANTCYGQADVDVTPSFAQELAQLQTKLGHIRPCQLYSSPLQRCHKLAQAMAQHWQQTHAVGYAIAVEQDARLKELHFGDWEMQNWNDIPRGLVDVWAEEHVMRAPPNGESFHALHQRAKAFLDSVCAQNEADNIVIFTHAGVIRSLLAEVLHLPLIHAFKFEVAYASVSQLIIESNVARVGYVNG
jgi:alpha-ribazole phosphatase